MAFIESPYLTDLFGASKWLDPELGQPIDDWVTFYQGIDRMIQVIKSNGQQGAFVTVLTGGSALFPSRRLRPTPRLDSGTFSSQGADPMRKDVVELMFRMFQREGLWLVPTLEFSSTLPDVEQLRDDLETTYDFELVDYRGNRAAYGLPRQLPFYNPLDARVQNAIAETIAEFGQRYRSFESFLALAVTCRPQANLTLPGRQWGFDSAEREM